MCINNLVDLLATKSWACKRDSLWLKNCKHSVRLAPVTGKCERNLMDQRQLPPHLLKALSQILERRQFIKIASALGILAGYKGAVYGSKAFGKEALPEFKGHGKKVVVLGGGLAGLCAAYELGQRGFQVTILEKTQRISGRVWTQYHYFDDGQYCELGATRIPDCHHLTTGYARKFGLQLTPLDFGGDDNTLYYLDGVKRFKKEGVIGNQKSWPENRSLIESAYTSKAFPLLGNPHELGWPTRVADGNKISKLDSLTFAEFLKEIGYSDFAQKVVIASNGSEATMYSALLWLAGEYLEKEWNKTLRIEGGNEQLAHHFVKNFAPASTQVEYLAEVTEVVATKDQVSIYYRQRGELKRIDSNYCISTLPLDVLKKVKWSPALSREKIKASEEVIMQPVTRVNLQFRDRFWEKAPYKLKGLKVLHSDLVIERLWDMTGSEDQKNRISGGKSSQLGILTAYIQHENARKVGALDPKGRIQFVLEQIAPIFPEAKSNFHKGGSFLWHAQDWVGGGWSAYRPGQSPLFQATQVREGRIYFAGDHTSLEPGWIQGALQSAHRVVSELAQSSI